MFSWNDDEIHLIQELVLFTATRVMPHLNRQLKRIKDRGKVLQNSHERCLLMTVNVSYNYLNALALLQNKRQ